MLTEPLCSVAMKPENKANTSTESINNILLQISNISEKLNLIHISTSTGKYVGRLGFPTLMHGRSAEYRKSMLRFLTK